MSIDFSLVLPTRERVSLLDGLLKSLAETTANLDALEVYVAVDDDDRRSIEYAAQVRYPWLRWVIGPRAANFSETYYNGMAFQSSGRYVMAMNDDVKFLTPGWDALALPVLDEYKAQFVDGLMMGKCDDGLGERYPCFPILSREALQIAGWLFPPSFTAWGADIFLYRLYSALDRVVELPFAVEHLCHHTKTRERDDINVRMARMSRYDYDSVTTETMRIRKRIKEITSGVVSQ